MMRVLNKIIQYFFATIFAVSLLGLVLINIASSKILNESYVISKLEEEKYYDEVYENVKSNFENYIYQSGLEEEVLNDLVEKEKIKNDTKLILNNIYDGIDEEIDTTSISTKLNENIEESLGEKISNTQKKAIDDFVKKICKEYENTISNNKYKKNINKVILKVIKYVGFAEKALCLTAVISAILTTILTIKKIYRILARIGVALTVDGLILLITKKYIFLKVNIYGITIMGEAVSKVLRAILIDIFSTIFRYGMLFVISGLCLIVIYGIIKAIRKQKRIKEQYTPEN